MRSLGPALANVLLDFAKQSSSAMQLNHMYHLYVDNTFYHFIVKKSMMFFSFFSTPFFLLYILLIRKEGNGSLLFLDVLVEKSETEFITSVYRKLAFRGQCLNKCFVI